MAISTAEVGPADPEGAALDGAFVAVWRWFAISWAVAVVFHLAGNPRLAPEWGRGLLGATAILLLAMPRRPIAALPLALAVLANVWLEAPTLGNHWLLHGFVALVVIGAISSGRAGEAATARRLIGPARLVLLAFYCFAAFAKLNADFFDPAVSCAVFYLRESAGSWGALGLYDALPAWGDAAIAVAVAAIELSVPVLLVVRRTRHAGVVVALAFHWVLAVDRSHQFFDFSSILAVLFVLFLDPRAVARLVDRLHEASRAIARRWASGPELIRLLGLAIAAAAVVTAAGPDRWSTVRPLREVGVIVWLVVGGAAIALVVDAVRRSGLASGRLVPPGTRRWLLAIPMVAALNGLTPYLEIKSGFGWNMYSNLAVVDGESNHFVIRSGLPLTDGHERLVEVVETTEPALAFYDSRWLLPEAQLIDYLADRDGAEVEGVVDGESVTYRGGRSGRPTWQQKLQLFRAVDADGPTNCQPSFGPAR